MGCNELLGNLAYCTCFHICSSGTLDFMRTQGHGLSESHGADFDSVLGRMQLCRGRIPQNSVSTSVGHPKRWISKS